MRAARTANIFSLNKGAHGYPAIVQFGAESHVHGPNCNHDHEVKDSFEAKETHEHHDHDHHDHDAVKEKPGAKFKNPIVRAVVNFFGWFYEFFASFFKDILGKKPDKEHVHTHGDGHAH